MLSKLPQCRAKNNYLFLIGIPIFLIMNVFITGFWAVAVICAILFFYTRQTTGANIDPEFRRFQQTYLVVYLLAMAGDWLQGPYVYALYDFYGMTTHDIEVLFVAGFGSSMLLGTVVGSMADKYGRRMNCIIYCVLYGMACVTKHFNNFYILMLGRLLGGMATSILYSAFESWMIYEHRHRNFDDHLVGSTFSQAVLGNSVVAIIAGLVAQFCADYFGYVAPFDASLAVLSVLAIILVFTWSENYGDAKVKPMTSMANGFQAIKSDRKVLMLGIIQSLFEGSMYTFVLEWTPALTPEVEHHNTDDAQRHLLEGDEDTHHATIPHGYIFAGFMVAIMIGSSLYSLLSKRMREESFMRPVFFVAALSLSAPVLVPGNQAVIFSGFLLFEVCVGIFWPAMGTLRSRYVPETTRATVMTLCRIPLNLVVIFILTQNLALGLIFKCCIMFLLIATVCQHILYSLYLNIANTKPTAAGFENKSHEVTIAGAPSLLEVKQALMGENDTA